MIRSITRVEHTDHPACGAQRIPPHSPPCTLPAGHTGWHLATDETGNETLAYWPNSTTTERAYAAQGPRAPPESRPERSTTRRTQRGRPNPYKQQENPNMSTSQAHAELLAITARLDALRDDLAMTAYHYETSGDDPARAAAYRDAGRKLNSALSNAALDVMAATR